MYDGRCGGDVGGGQPLPGFLGLEVVGLPFINLPGVGHSFFLFILYYLAHVLVERKDDQPPLTPNPQRALT